MIGSKATYKTSLAGYVLVGIITAVDADGFVTFDAGSRGSFNLAANDPDLIIEWREAKHNAWKRQADREALNSRMGT